MGSLSKSNNANAGNTISGVNGVCLLVRAKVKKVEHVTRNGTELHMKFIKAEKTPILPRFFNSKSFLTCDNLSSIGFSIAYSLMDLMLARISFVTLVLWSLYFICVLNVSFIFLEITVLIGIITAITSSPEKVAFPNSEYSEITQRTNLIGADTSTWNCEPKSCTLEVSTESKLTISPVLLSFLASGERRSALW
ncbi:hypothetical protein WICPIJ_001575 [Wickerhamomyces pijperi]|uniref:Uncharacterized protein n=1 Tax=Wickerhamomyces pijperi TaxID=599730 RepID=A0A9P8QD29_WICPI|nr:hypothetical protein WICPIJ_001575 [Wickerhamomyces pijperi]